MTERPLEQEQQTEIKSGGRGKGGRGRELIGEATGNMLGFMEEINAFNGGKPPNREAREECCL